MYSQTVMNSEIQNQWKNSFFLSIRNFGNQTPKAATIKPLLHKDMDGMEVDVIDYRSKPLSLTLHTDLPSCPTVTISMFVTNQNNQKIDILAIRVLELLRILFTILWAQLLRMASNSIRILSILRDVETYSIWKIQSHGKTFDFNSKYDLDRTVKG